MRMYDYCGSINALVNENEDLDDLEMMNECIISRAIDK
jgi:hypothetical protein